MFKDARIKLTAWYLLIIMFISVCFSMMIYKVLTNEVDRFSRAQRTRIERRLVENNFSGMPITVSDPDLVREINSRLILFLIIINGTIFVFSGVLGYFLAGKTLHPISEMIDEQNRFVSDASHEFRTPLTSLKSAMEVALRDKNFSLDEAKTLIKENIDDVNKLHALSEELLRLTQYQKPNNNLKFTTVSISEIVKAAVKKMEPLAKKKKITIKKMVTENKLKGNKDKLTELLIILLDNAIKYSREKTTVIISSKKTDGEIAISVKDTGIGIDKEDLPFIFDRFYRADSARTKTAAGGYGLGLSIAKKIVELHYGKIKVNSKINKGTTFTINIPIS